MPNEENNHLYFVNFYCHNGSLLFIYYVTDSQGYRSGELIKISYKGVVFNLGKVK